MKELEKLLNEIISNEDSEGLELRYTFIEELLNYRKQYKLTQNEFAKKLGLKQQAIARFEKGEVDPRLSFIYKILKGINKKISFENIKYAKFGTVSYVSSQKKSLEFSGEGSFNKSA